MWNCRKCFDLGFIILVFILGKRCTSSETRNGNGLLHSLFNGSDGECFAGTDVCPCAKRHGVVLEPPVALVEVDLWRQVTVQEAIVLERLWGQKEKVSIYNNKFFCFNVSAHGSFQWRTTGQLKVLHECQGSRWSCKYWRTMTTDKVTLIKQTGSTLVMFGQQIAPVCRSSSPLMP